jgi:hypothetical protein
MLSSAFAKRFASFGLALLFPLLVVSEAAAQRTVVLQDDEQVRAVIQAKGSRGRPAVLDGAPQWTTSAPTILAVDPEPDGMAAVIRALGPEGEGDVTAIGDSDPGPGVVPVTGTLHVQVPAPMARDLDLIPDAVSKQPLVPEVPGGPAARRPRR